MALSWTPCTQVNLLDRASVVEVWWVNSKFKQDRGPGRLSKAPSPPPDSLASGSLQEEPRAGRPGQLQTPSSQWRVKSPGPTCRRDPRGYCAQVHTDPSSLTLVALKI